MAAMGGPYEALGHDRISLVVDLESAAVHEPGPGAFDDPALGEFLEAARVDAIHHLDSDMMVPAVLDEGALESSVAPQLGEASGAVPGTIGHVDSAGVVRGARRDDDHRHEKSEGVYDPEGLAAVDLLSGIETLGFLAYRGRGAHRARIDNASGGFAVTALSLAHRRGQPLGDALPGAV